MYKVTGSDKGADSTHPQLIVCDDPHKNTPLFITPEQQQEAIKRYKDLMPTEEDGYVKFMVTR